MNTMTIEPQAAEKEQLRPPAGLHHFNFYTRDLEACRRFYEDVAGLPLVAFWIEPMPEAFGTRGHVVGHAFFGMANGTIMAFMHYPDADLQEKSVGTEQSGTVHVALKVDAEQFASIRDRARKGGYRVADIDHGVARALYVRDPDGLLVEFSLETPETQAYFNQGPKARENFERYLAGDRTPNTPEKAKY